MSKLVLVRHGQSIWNKENRFTGWVDVSLSGEGLRQAKRAGIKLKNIKFDCAFTSGLIRAQQTLYEILNRNNLCDGFVEIHEKGSKWYSHLTKNKSDGNSNVKVYESEKLNERYYGDLQGLNKEETSKKFGLDLVMVWRRSYKTPPPGGNALQTTYNRTIPYFKSHIEPKLKDGENILIAAHGNSLRSIIKYIEKVSDDEISKIELETGVPYLYTFDKNIKLIKKEKL